MTPRRTSLLLDLDGTLTDPKDGITRSIAFALEHMGVAPPSADDLEFAIGPPLRASFATLLGSGDAVAIERAMTLYRERFSTVGLLENTVYAGVPEMLGELKAAGFRLLVATAKPHVYATRILDHFGLRLPFDAIHGSELDGTRQHKSDLLAYLLAAEHLAAEHCVMIGDRQHDIDAARANQCQSIGVTWGYGSAEEFQFANATCDSPAQLLGHLSSTYS